MEPIKKIYVSIIVFFIAIAFLTIFLIYPSFSKIRNNSGELLLTKNRIALLAKEEEERKKLESFYQVYQLDLEFLEKVFFDADLPIDLINFLEENASKSQVQIKIPSIKKEINKEDSWPVLLIQFAVIGYFPNSLEFLEKLESGPYLVQVLDFSARKLTESELRGVDVSLVPLVDTTTILNIEVFTQK